MEKKVKNNKKDFIFEINEKLDIAYIGISPTNTSTIGIDLDEDITCHYDTKKKQIIGITIIHWDRLKQKLYLKEKAKESIKTINEYILKHYPTISLPTFLILPESSHR